MNIQSINQNSSYRSQKHTNFTGIHIARYFVKDSNGDFYNVTSRKEVKKMQRKLITWLNKGTLDNQKKIKGLPTKKQNPKTKPLADRLVTFFLRRDNDYAQRRMAKSFYTTNSLRQTESYILTGDSIKIIEDAAALIENARHYIKHKAGVISEYNGIKLEDARKFISHEEELEIMEAASKYHQRAKSTIRQLLATYNPRNMRFDAYFEPKINKSKSEIDYVLVDAKFDGQ